LTKQFLNNQHYPLTWFLFVWFSQFWPLMHPSRWKFI